MNLKHILCHITSKVTWLVEWFRINVGQSDLFAAVQSRPWRWSRHSSKPPLTTSKSTWIVIETTASQKNGWINWLLQSWVHEILTSCMIQVYKVQLLIKQFLNLPGASVEKICPSVVSWQAVVSHVFVFLPTPKWLLLLHVVTGIKTHLILK